MLLNNFSLDFKFFLNLVWVALTLFDTFLKPKKDIMPGNESGDGEINNLLPGMYHHPKQESLHSSLCEVPGGSPPSGSHGLRKGQAEIALLWGKCQAAPISVVDRPCQVHSTPSRLGSWCTPLEQSQMSLIVQATPWLSSIYSWRFIWHWVEWSSPRSSGKLEKIKEHKLQSNWMETPGPQVKRDLTVQHWLS